MTVPHATRARWFDPVRYEDGAWPLYRWDRNLAYVAKSLAHRVAPRSEADRAHHTAARAFLDAGTWQRALPDALTLCLGGDLMWIRDGWGEHLSPALEAWVQRADLSLVNLETPMDPLRRVPRWTYETFHYNAPAEYLRPWRAARPCVMSLCNNHALDQGREGLLRTHACLEAHGVVPLGGPRDEHAVRLVSLPQGRVAVTGTTYGINHLTGAAPDGIPVVRFGSPRCAPDWTAMARLVARAQRCSPDLVVLMAHWGFEYECWPAALQRAHARRLLALGVDVIVGSSPHVLQPVEVVSIDGADPQCPTQVHRGGAPRFGLIAWSLGNLSTIMPTLRCQTAALLEATFGRTASGALSLAGLRAQVTHSARGNGRSRLGACTLDLSALQGRSRDAPRVAAMARAALGNLLVREVS